jgi:hypothetical protein
LFAPEKIDSAFEFADLLAEYYPEEEEEEEDKSFIYLASSEDPNPDLTKARKSSQPKKRPDRRNAQAYQLDPNTLKWTFVDDAYADDGTPHPARQMPRLAQTSNVVKWDLNGLDPFSQCWWIQHNDNLCRFAKSRYPAVGIWRHRAGRESIASKRDGSSRRMRVDNLDRRRIRIVVVLLRRRFPRMNCCRNCFLYYWTCRHSRTGIRLTTVGRDGGLKTKMRQCHESEDIECIYLMHHLRSQDEWKLVEWWNLVMNLLSWRFVFSHEITTVYD